MAELNLPEGFDKWDPFARRKWLDAVDVHSAGLDVLNAINDLHGGGVDYIKLLINQKQSQIGLQQQIDQINQQNDPKYLVKQWLDQYGFDTWNSDAANLYREQWQSGKARRFTPLEMENWAKQYDLYVARNNPYPTTVTNTPNGTDQQTGNGGQAQIVEAEYNRGGDIRPWGGSPVRQPIEQGPHDQSKYPVTDFTDGRGGYGGVDRVIARPGVDFRNDPAYKNDLPVSRRPIRVQTIGGRGW